MPQPRWRAPREHGGVLAAPPLAEAPRLLEQNRARFAAADLDLLGRKLSDVRIHAAKETRALAGQYLAMLGISVPCQDQPAGQFVVAGHQPDLFHPGVWVKDFAVQGLATKHGLTPLHLIVDNDNLKGTALKLPDFTATPAQVKTVAYDRWTGPMPYEEREVLDESMFAAFPAAVDAETRAWPFRPVLAEFWQGALELREHTPILGERLAGARRRFEERWGCRNLELPLSRLCRTESFAWFASHLLAHLPRFHEIHNRALGSFRRRHGVRSRHHPVPELAVDGDWAGWLEAPFWVWRPGESRRARLFARQTPAGVELRRRDQVFGRLPLVAGKEHQAVAAWHELDAQGFKLRTRALTTTLFARVFLAELFVHGIGGGIYDELTDDIIRQFYALEPPGFLVLSATLYLPFPEPVHAGPGPLELQQTLRDLWYNPQRHIQDQADALCREKQAWIEHVPADAPARRQRFQALQEINRRLRPLASGRRNEVARQLVRSQEFETIRSVVQNRERAFCLYPSEELRRLCLPFLEA